MSDRFVTHDTMVLERHYPAAPERVFAAFAEPAAKVAWWFSGDDDMTRTDHEMDFRVGGREYGRATVGDTGPVFVFDARYDDIVENRRIVYSYFMSRDDVRISVSVTCIEFAADGDGTRLVLTEHGVYLDGEDQPEFRKEGIGEQLDGLGRMLAAAP